MIVGFLKEREARLVFESRSKKVGRLTKVRKMGVQIGQKNVVGENYRSTPCAHCLVQPGSLPDGVTSPQYILYITSFCATNHPFDQSPLLSTKTYDRNQRRERRS